MKPNTIYLQDKKNNRLFKSFRVFYKYCTENNLKFSFVEAYKGTFTYSLTIKNFHITCEIYPEYRTTLSAYEKVEELLDEDSFNELDISVYDKPLDL
jgi:acetyl-CoA carboxylase beta subunit